MASGAASEPPAWPAGGRPAQAAAIAEGSRAGRAEQLDEADVGGQRRGLLGLLRVVVAGQAAGQLECRRRRHARRFDRVTRLRIGAPQDGDRWKHRPHRRAFECEHLTADMRQDLARLGDDDGRSTRGQQPAGRARASGEGSRIVDHKEQRAVLLDRRAGAVGRHLAGGAGAERAWRLMDAAGVR